STSSAAAPPAGAAAAAATGAAAVTSKVSSNALTNSLSSMSVSSLNASSNWSVVSFAIDLPYAYNFVVGADGRLRGPLLNLNVELRPEGVDGTNRFRQRCVEQVRSAEQRLLEGTGQLGQQHLPAFEFSKLLDLGCSERVTVEVTALDDQQRVCLGEVLQTLCNGDRVSVNKGDC